MKEPAVPSPSALPRAWIALGVGEVLPPHLIAYAAGACRRMQAGLLLLSRNAPHAHALLAPHLPNLQDIACRTVELESGTAASIVQALERQRGVLFAVSGVEDDPLRPLLRPRREARAPVPVVLVSLKADAS